VSAFTPTQDHTGATVEGGGQVYARPVSVNQDFCFGMSGFGSSFVQVTDAGSGQEIFQGSGSSNVQFTDAGVGQSSFVGSGSGHIQFVGAGVGEEIFSGSGSDNVHFVSIGRACIPFVFRKSTVVSSIKEFPVAVGCTETHDVAVDCTPIEPKDPTCA
jgi:hypothetical protein